MLTAEQTWNINLKEAKDFGREEIYKLVDGLLIKEEVCSCNNLPSSHLFLTSINCCISYIC